jgi:hypothetical protein
MARQSARERERAFFLSSSSVQFSSVTTRLLFGGATPPVSKRARGARPAPMPAPLRASSRRTFALDSLHGHVALLSRDLTIRYGTRAVPLAWPATTPCASHTRRLNEKNRSFSSARGPLRARGGHLRSHGGGAHGRSTRDGCSCCSRVLRLYGARESALLQPKLLPTADLLVLLVYIWGKRGTSLAQMLDWRSLFPQAPPINGLC